MKQQSTQTSSLREMLRLRQQVLEALAEALAIVLTSELEETDLEDEESLQIFRQLVYRQLEDLGSSPGLLPVAVLRQAQAGQLFHLQAYLEANLELPAEQVLAWHRQEVLEWLQSKPSQEQEDLLNRWAARGQLLLSKVRVRLGD